MFYIYILKRGVEDIFIFPLICIGRVFYKFCLFKKEYEIIFFFPFYHIGGAEKVHAQIAAAVGNSNCLIIFTKKSQNNSFFNAFKKTGCDIRDISKFTDNKWMYFLNLVYRGIIAKNINNQKNKPIVFNGQCNFGYKISPWIKKGIIQIELIHALNSFSYIRIPFIENYTHSLTVSNEILKKHLNIYKKIYAPLNLYKRISFIETGIELPKKQIFKVFHEPILKVLYVGRATSEKRVYLVAQIAKQVISTNSLIEFHFVGDVINSIPFPLQQYCIFHGDISDERILSEIYDFSNILIVTSSTESGPLVTMEAMARGLAIITTQVGFVAEHLKNEENGLLIKRSVNEKIIIKQATNYVKKLYTNRMLLKHIAKNNIEYAKNNFDIKKFNTQYKELIDRYK